MSDLAYDLSKLAQNITVLDTPDEAAPTCPDCEGTGYVSYNVATNDPRFGKLFKCPNPDCPAVHAQHLRQAEEIMKHSSWSQAYGQMSFDSFLGLLNESELKGKRGAFAAAYAFAYSQGAFTLNQASQHAWKRDWPKATEHISQSVVLTGGVGLGKTGLAVSATNALRGQGKPVIFIRARDLIRKIQETYRADWGNIGNETPDQRLRRFTNVPFLIVDEFAVENYSEDRLEIIETIIRERDRMGLPFMATTNLSQEEFRDGDHWQMRIGDIVDKAHWIPCGGLKLRKTSQTAAGEW